MTLRLRVGLTAAVCAAALLFAAGAEAAGAQMQAVQAQMTQLAGPEARALLLFFVASDCPISNRYFPEIERLRMEFASQHVAVRYVYPNPEETAAGVAKHQVEFHAPTALAYRDRNGDLTYAAGMTTTPEAALFLRKGDRWEQVFHGRIDDRYVRFGVERPQPQHHDAEDAVRAVLAGRPVPHPDGPPVGCGIVKWPLVRGAKGE